LELCGVAVALLAATVGLGSEPGSLRLGSDEWPPFTGSPGTTRSAIELVHTALERAGIEATTTIAEWRRVEAMIRRGELDGSAAMWRTEEREEILLFSAPYLENRLVLVGRTGSDVSATRIDDLSGRRVAAVGRYAYGDDIDSAVGVIFVNSRSDQDSLDKLLAGEVEYMLVEEIVARHLLTFQPDEVAENLEIGLIPLARRTLHLAIRRDVPEAAEIIAAFDRQIRDMQSDGTFASILQVGWIRIDVDGDGLFELVPPGEQVGNQPPSSVYDVFGTVPEDQQPEKPRVVIKGDIYEGWDAIPDLYKQAPSAPSPGGAPSLRHGTTVMTLKF
jgi:ABC-type amino acid transport substrate-binding protein